ncbi:MAG: hypothetical protein ACR2QW_13825 [bacterium]
MTIPAFCIRFFWFIVCVSLAFVPTYMLLDTVQNSKDPQNSVFIWGDSQTFRGIDLAELGNLTGKQVYTAARHGASVYDFLRFSEAIPQNATAIVALSRTVQVRRKHRDQNLSGLSFRSLFALGQANFNLREILRIIKNNIKPKNLFATNTKLYENKKDVIDDKSIKVFQRIYSKVPHYLADKQWLYMQGINNLLKKNIEVTFVEFPFHPLLESIERGSVIKPLTDQFQDQVIRRFPDHNLNSVSLGTADNLMYDLTHLNSRGATLVARHLAENLIQARPKGLILFKTDS